MGGEPQGDPGDAGDSSEVSDAGDEVISAPVMQSGGTIVPCTHIIQKCMLFFMK